MRNDDRHLVFAHKLLYDFAEFELAFRLCDAMDGEAAERVVEHAEHLVCLVDLNDVLKAGRKAHLRAHFSVHFDQTLLADCLRLFVRRRVAQSIAEEKDERQTLAQLVRAASRPRRERAAELRHHPMLRRIETLQMMLRSASHV